MNGIHHVTAIAGDIGRNLDFYTRVLGLRLVKQTVNFDDPSAYHLYFGDPTGSPGTIVTFFAWPGAAPGRRGNGELAETSFRVPRSSLDAWSDRLAPHGPVRTERFGDPVLGFRDPDGTSLALVGCADLDGDPAIGGLHGVALAVADGAPTAAILSDVFGFRPVATDGDAQRLAVPGATMGGTIDLRVGRSAPATAGRGSVHHLAFRTPDDAAQAAMVDRLARLHGLHTTEQKDRDYFRSVYFREPGGILFEIATDIPGFAVDEDPSALGAALQLPRFLRPDRARIEASLPSLARPG